MVGRLLSIALERISSLIRHVNERRDAYRAPALACALFVFMIGCAVSYVQLDVRLSDLRWGPLAILACLIAPSLIYGGFGLVLLAQSAGLSMRLGRATVTSAYAYLSELLPLPGGAIVRTGALVRAGGSVRTSSLLVLLTAILWIALAIIGAGLTLLPTSLGFAWPLLLVGTTAAGGVLRWLWAMTGARVTTLTFLHRVFGIALTALRLQFAFAALGVSIAFSDTLPFVLALLLGSASSIAPAGLGVSEALAAMAATTSQYSPATAFLAVGLDRLLCLAGCALVTSTSQILDAQSTANNNKSPAPVVTDLTHG